MTLTPPHLMDYIRRANLRCIKIYVSQSDYPAMAKELANALAVYEPRHVVTTLEGLLDNCKEWPSFAEIREQIEQLTQITEIEKPPNVEQINNKQRLRVVTDQIARSL